MTDGMRVWVIRANDGRWAEAFAENGYIGLHHGMDGVDMSGVRSRDEVRRLFEQEHPDETNERSIANRAGQVANFHLEIKSGDYVLTPGLGSSVRYGKFFTNQCYYVAIDDGLPTRNRRLVEWSPTALNRHDLPRGVLQGGTTLYEVGDTSGLREFLVPIENSKDQNVWIVRGGRNAHAVATFLERRYAGIGFGLEDDDLSVLSDADEIRNLYQERNPSGSSSSQIIQFCLEMKPGDYVIMPGPGSTINHYGRFTSDVFNDGLGPYKNKRNVEWSDRTITREELDLSGYRPTVTRLTGDLRERFLDIIASGFQMPEDSWVPFHLEVGLKLVEGEWWLEHRREDLERRIRLIVASTPNVGGNEVDERWSPDPFSLYLAFNLRTSPAAQRIPAYGTVKALFELDANLPSEHHEAVGYGLMGRFGERLKSGEIETLWEFFRLAQGQDPIDDPDIAPLFVKLFDRLIEPEYCSGLRGPKVSYWLYWVDPTRYIYAEQLQKLGILNDLGLRKDTIDGKGYVSALAAARQLAAKCGRSLLDLNRWGTTSESLGLGAPREVGTDSDNGAVGVNPYGIDDMLNDGLFFEREELERILGRFEDKKNLILQGPPGVGKTFVSKRLAYALMGERADRRIRNVQFHQSYSYEEFVQGYRPTTNVNDELKFELLDGTFLELCDEARDRPDDRYVIVIDEINRGNLSRVFGELLSMIENDKRGEGFVIRLAGGNEFWVPENVYILGTMNLADRSLAGMDYAMRRRFAFVTLKPQFGESVFEDWLRDRDVPDTMIEQINSRMSALNEVIASDASLGRNFAVGHSYFCDIADGGENDWDGWYREIVKTEIQPLLEEYWFDDLKKADVEVGKLLEG